MIARMRGEVIEAANGRVVVDANGVGYEVQVPESVFLAIGNARDGAPAHHPERALLGAMAIAALFSADACAHLASAIGRLRRTRRIGRRAGAVDLRRGRRTGAPRPMRVDG